MKNNIRFVNLYFVICLIMFFACNQQNVEVETPTSQAEIFVSNNMFVFQSYFHINQIIMSFNKLSENGKKEWYKKYGIKTYGQLFKEVIEKEDSISNYYSSLPEEEQKYFLSQPQIHSDLYKETLKRGVIKEIKTEDNEYFDMNLIDKKYADFLNLDGKVMIGQDIMSINDCEKKIYLNANNSSPSELEKMKAVTLKTNDGFEDKLKSGDPYNWSQTKGKIEYEPNWLGRNQKRVWAEIQGLSYLVIAFPEESDHCARSVYCDFYLKAYAQKRNFWGNFVFGNWSPLVQFTGTWNYQHTSWNRDDPQLHDQCLCGYYSTDNTTGYNDFPSYSCFPNPSYMCPTSPLNYSDYGNGYILPVTPDGIFPYSWGDGGMWWSWPIQVYNANIIIRIDTQLFVFTW